MQDLLIHYKEPIEFEIRIYDVAVGGEDIDFSADTDSDGDIRIELEEKSFEEIAVKYLRYNNSDEELKEMFGIDDAGDNN